jgi:hypothetical protein
MISFMDRCFCTFFKDCWHKDECSRALTLDVQMAAAEWWGSSDVPIDVFVDKPECFKENM